MLRKLVQNCNYKDKLLEMLWDRLVCGDDHKRWWLIVEPDLTFNKTLKLAQVTEDVRGLQSLEVAPS